MDKSIGTSQRGTAPRLARLSRNATHSAY